MTRNSSSLSPDHENNIPEITTLSQEEIHTEPSHEICWETCPISAVQIPTTDEILLTGGPKVNESPHQIHQLHSARIVPCHDTDEAVLPPIVERKGNELVRDYANKLNLALQHTRRTIHSKCQEQGWRVCLSGKWKRERHILIKIKLLSLHDLLLIRQIVEKQKERTPNVPIDIQLWLKCERTNVEWARLTVRVERSRDSFYGGIATYRIENGKEQQGPTYVELNTYFKDKLHDLAKWWVSCWNGFSPQDMECDRENRIGFLAVVAAEVLRFPVIFLIINGEMCRIETSLAAHSTIFDPREWLWQSVGGEKLFGFFLANDWDPSERHIDKSLHSIRRKDIEARRTFVHDNYHIKKREKANKKRRLYRIQKSQLLHIKNHGQFPDMAHFDTIKDYSKPVFDYLQTE